MKTQSCCFVTAEKGFCAKTHPTALRAALTELILKEHIRYFILTNTHAFSLAAGEAVLSLRQAYPTIKLLIFYTGHKHPLASKADLFARASPVYAHSCCRHVLCCGNPVPPPGLIFHTLPQL